MAEYSAPTRCADAEDGRDRRTVDPDLPARTPPPHLDLEPAPSPARLREFEEFYNSHRPHQGVTNARPLCPPPINDPGQIVCLDIRRRQRLGRILNEYEHAA